MIDVTISGIEEIILKMNQLGDSVKREILEPALDTIANEIKNIMADNAPRRGGNLKASISLVKSKPGDYPTRFIGPNKTPGIDAFYWLFVERGHHARNGDWIKARPFVRKTFDSTKDWAKNALDAMVKEGIEKKWNSK